MKRNRVVQFILFDAKSTEILGYVGYPPLGRRQPGWSCPACALYSGLLALSTLSEHFTIMFPDIIESCTL